MQTVVTLEHQDLNIPATSGKFALAASGKYLGIGGTNGSLFLFDLEKKEFEEEFDSPFIKKTVERRQSAIDEVRLSP